MGLAARIFLIVALAAGVVAAASGAHYRSTTESLQAEHNAKAAGERLGRAFLVAHKLTKALPVAPMDLAGGRDELADPATSLPRTFAFDAAEVRRLSEYADRG